MTEWLLYTLIIPVTETFLLLLLLLLTVPSLSTLSWRKLSPGFAAARCVIRCADIHSLLIIFAGMFAGGDFLCGSQVRGRKHSTVEEPEDETKTSRFMWWTFFSYFSNWTTAVSPEDTQQRDIFSCRERQNTFILLKKCVFVSAALMCCRFSHLLFIIEKSNRSWGDLPPSLWKLEKMSQCELNPRVKTFLCATERDINSWLMC